MAVCYFDSNYETKYNCDYEETENYIEVTVNYEIEEEIPSDSNGVKTYGIDTKFKERDILIIDYNSRKNFLLKEAFYNGRTDVYGTPDDEHKTKFRSSWYFVSMDYEKLCNLSKMPEVEKIKVYTNLVNDFIGYPSLSTISNDNEHIINLKNNSQKKIIQINENNVKSLAIGDCWYSKHQRDKYLFQINFDGYIELELENSINYDEVYDYIKELCVFMQLICPNKFVISKIIVFIDEKQYELHMPIENLKINSKNIYPSVKENLLSFLNKCYKNIPYRNSKNEIRNIPYIILNTSRNIEDNFLMFYRFIECYYKDKGRNNDFISYSIDNNYKHNNSYNVEDLTCELISLRNHYVHDGYFIKNGNLEITYKKIKGRKNPKDYIAQNVNLEWIYERTKILYDIVIDIIFSDMLNYKNYEFNKHF